MNSNIVLDTNVLISRALFANSTVAKVVNIAFRDYNPICSQETFEEFVSTLRKKKLRKYFHNDNINHLINEYAALVEWIPIVERVTHCRDKKDDKFLELAVNGRAHCIITGDDDLLGISSFRNIKILSPQKFARIVAKYSNNNSEFPLAGAG